VVNDDKKKVVVVAETGQGRVLPVTSELITAAEEIGRVGSWPVRAVVLGDQAEKTAQEISRAFGWPVIAGVNRHLGVYNGELYKEILGRLLPALNPAFVCLAHTSRGWDYGPGLAVRLGAACITGVERIRGTEQGLTLTRTMFGGKITADVISTAATTVLTIQPGAFKAQVSDNSHQPQVEVLRFETEPRLSKFLGMKNIRESNAALNQAEVVVAAGRGVVKPENLALIRRLAALFPKAAVAGSRPVCDAGWLEYKRQVGQTGTTVSPRLYLACGISGARQHTIGMQDSDFIVAISTDPNAAIFNLADVGIVEDLTTFIPVLIDELEKV